MKKLLVPTIQIMIVAIITFFGFFQGCGLFDAGSGFWIDVPDQTVDFDLNLGTAQITSIPQPAQQTFSIELPPKQVDLSTQEQLKAYVDSGKIKAIRIKYFKYILTTNTATIDLPPFNIFMDRYEVTSITDSSIKVAQLPSIKAGRVGDGDLKFVQGGKEAMSNFFLGLKFTVLGQADVTIDSGTIPSGELKGTFTIGLQFKVNPL